ncbi:MAG: efflux RND transporter permease subunit [Candidatus Cloacimonetes bacterium]|jgi:HAE1 family hydrophobic/amphiphilic exporter-1|nr:efflux RND transporter permease subunit [Candidatus Cloacimonadota bacterium]
MFLSKISINRPILTTMVLAVFIVFGAIAYFSLSLNLMPEADIPFVTIQTIYAGAGPNEVENLISKKIEDAVSTISKIDYMESYSMDNVSILMIAFELGKDIDIAVAEVKQKVDAISRSLPSDADKPSVDKVDFTAFPIMEIILTGNQDGRELYEIADKQLKDRLSQIEGVASVDINGGQKREIHVKLDDRVVYQNMISLPQLTQILSVHNMDMPGGQFQQNDQEYSVRLEGELASINELNDLEIPTAFGMKKLRQIADVQDSGEEIRKRSIFFNNITKERKENVVQLSIVKTSDGNPVNVAKDVRKELEELRQILPEGTELTIVSDDSDYIKSSVSDTLNNVFLGILFTGIVLLFFLHDIRSTIIVAVAMPTSIISTFMVMQWAGFSLNILSLMGLSTAVGILVTNSVVVLENIFRHKEMGHSRRVAADIGTAETTVAVLASTLTNIVVFLPLAMMDTMVGQFIKEFALTVTFATVFSLIISFTLTPMLASILIPEERKTNKIGEAAERMFHSWEATYRKILAFILHTKWRSAAVTILAFILFIGTMKIVGSKLAFELLPSSDESKIQINYELPVGFNLEQTADMYKDIEEIVIQHEEIQQILVNLGSQGRIDESVNLASMTVTLVDVKDREISTDNMVTMLIQDLSSLSNVKIKVSPKSSMGGGESPIEFYLKGTNMDQLTQITEKFLFDAKELNGLINFDSNLKTGKPEITLVPYRDKLAASGLTIYDLALTLRSSVGGMNAASYREKGEEYDMIISLTDESVDSPEEIKNIPVVGPMGVYRLSQLAEVKFTSGATMIVHRDKIKSAKFTGDIAAGAALSNIVNSLRALQEETELPEGFSFSWGGTSEMMEENILEMGKALMIAILLTYMLLAAILESFTKPLLILMTMPLALIGVIIILYITHLNLGMVVMMGIIMLLGIVVNAAILIMDYTQQLREQGKTTKEALLEASPTKLKPILMSAVAIIFGMLPMALGIGEAGAEMRQPLGIVSIGGIIVSTIMTLYVIPAMYLITTKRNVKHIAKV